MRFPSSSLRWLAGLVLVASCSTAGAQVTDPLSPPFPAGITVRGNVNGVWVLDDAQRRVTIYAHVNGGVTAVPWR